MYIEGELDGGGRMSTIAAYITLSSAIYYATAIMLLHIIRTDFDPRYRYLSEYVNGPYGALMTSTFFVLSLGSLALLFGLWRSVSSKLPFVPGMLLWLAWACAVFFAGIYPGDLQGSPQTRNGSLCLRATTGAAKRRSIGTKPSWRSWASDENCIALRCAQWRVVERFIAPTIPPRSRRSWKRMSWRFTTSVECSGGCAMTT
jgi:hypothetical protein